MGKVIQWELCKKLMFDSTNQWYMCNPESVLENDMHKLLWNFEIQTEHLMSARRPDLIIINKNEKNLQDCGLSGSGGAQSKIERIQKEGSC